METLVGLHPTFHIPNCLFIRQIYDLVAGPDGIFYLAGKPIRKAEIMGTVVKLFHFDQRGMNDARGKGGVSVTVDDSTGLLECFCPTQLLTADSEFAAEHVAEFGDIIAAIKQPPRLVNGLLVRVRGLLYAKAIRPYHLRAAAGKQQVDAAVVQYKKLHVTDLKVEHDPDALSHWILHVVRVSTEYLMAAKPLAAEASSSAASADGQEAKCNGRKRTVSAALKCRQLDELTKVLGDALATSEVKQLPFSFARLYDAALRTSFFAALSACGWSFDDPTHTHPTRQLLSQPSADVVGGRTVDALELRTAPADVVHGDGDERAEADEQCQMAWRQTLEELARRGVVYPSAKSAATVWSVADNDLELVPLVRQAVKECDTSGAGADSGAVRRALNCYARYRHLSWACVRRLLDKCVHDSLIVVCGSSSRGERVTYKIV